MKLTITLTYLASALALYLPQLEYRSFKERSSQFLNSNNFGRKKPQIPDYFLKFTKTPAKKNYFNRIGEEPNAFLTELFRTEGGEIFENSTYFPGTRFSGNDSSFITTYVMPII